MQVDNVNTSIPALAASFYTADQKAPNASSLNQIYSTYQNEIDQAVNFTRVAQEIITSVIFIESTGNPNAVSAAGAVGLMQLIPNSANDMLVLDNIHKRLTPPEQAVLRKMMGGRLDGLLKMKFLGNKVTANGTTSATWVTKNDLLNPEFNIMVGAIYLSILIDEERTDSDVRLDKVVARYNMGYFAKNAGKDLVGDINSLYFNLNPESKDYVLKLLGVNGTLDAMLNA